MRSSGKQLKQPFEHSKLSLTTEQQEAIKSFNITINDSFDNNGELENLLHLVDKFISRLGNNDPGPCLILANVIVDFVMKSLNEFAAETAILLIRTTNQSHHLFDMPRWHIDGDYFPSSSHQKQKAVCTLIGPGTLFYNITPAERSAFNLIPKSSGAAAREASNELLCDVTKRESTPELHASYFIAGDPDSGAVHSEPKMTGSRLFFSVLPGTQSQIKEYINKQEGLRKQLEEDTRTGKIKPIF